MLALACAAQAAELGDIAPRSYIGQPLAVDIELVSLTPEEALNLTVRLAQADVYRAANTAINPALASVRMQVEKRGQKQLLHVTTTRAVEAEYLHLYVELGAPGKSEVRLATVWLQRDPNPPPAPVVAAVAQPVAQSIPPASAMTPAQAEQIAAQARAARVAAAAEAAKVEAAKVEAAKLEAAKAEAAKVELAKAEAARERAKPAPLPSMHEAETGKPGEVKAAGQARRIAGVLVGSDGKPVAPSAREEASEVPVGVAQALLPLAPLPLPKGVKRPAPASCAPTGMSAKECVALDARNTEMAGKITELEGRLKALQGALGGAVPTATAVQAAPAAKQGAPGGAAAGTAPAVVAASQSAKPGAQAGGQAGGAAGPAKPAASAAAKPDASPAAAKNGAAASAAAGHAASSGAAEKAGAKMASASLSAQGETEAHAAKAEGASASAAAASAASAASGEAAASAAASVPTKQVRVLPKLKYKKEKEKPAEQSSSMLPLIGGGVGLLALLGGGFVFLRKRSAGAGPLKIWQGFRKKQADKPAPEPAVEPAPESVA
ncbi:MULTISPECIES: hypothetical protein [unclassified Duganella]|uniref:FimV/HubP-related protein n=1 Tax=unclassified Duganella TaxID=2636909 RepID=UPI001029AF37|nr:MULTISPECIES: hypothetical protein [unclassified Duganella]